MNGGLILSFELDSQSFDQTLGSVLKHHFSTIETELDSDTIAVGEPFFGFAAFDFEIMLPDLGFEPKSLDFRRPRFGFALRFGLLVEIFTIVEDPDDWWRGIRADLDKIEFLFEGEPSGLINRYRTE